MRRICVLIAPVLICFLCMRPSLGNASGYRLPDQSASAMGMGGAFAGQADDPSAAWYNPAGITQLDGTRIAGGVSVVFPSISHENVDGTTDFSKRDISVPFHFYATDKLNEKMFLGLSINNPFGLLTNWSSTSETSLLGTFSKVNSIEVNPSIAYKFTDRFSAAIGIDYIYFKATLEKMLDTSTGDNLRLTGDGDAWGVNAALFYKATDNLSFGFSYRRKLRVEISGTAEASGGAISNPLSSVITLPDLIQFGASYKITDKLTVNADLDYTRWSTFSTYDARTDTLIPIIGSNIKTEYEYWKNVWCFRIGGQYKLSDQWKLRAGYFYDQNPVNDEWFSTPVPDSDRQGITVGTGYANRNITVDLAFMYVHFNKRTIHDSLIDDETATPDALNGAYKSEALVAGITLGYKFK